MPGILFPGQGTQNDIRSDELAAADHDVARLYETVADLTGLDLRSLSQQQLQTTRCAQLAIATYSLAVWQLWRKRHPEAAATAFAGFSLGEYTALAAANVLSLPDLLTLLTQRAAFMQEAVDAVPGGMVAIIGLETDQISQILTGNQWSDRVWIANDNAPGQTVIAGYKPDVAACAAVMRDAGARRALPLDVQGAFHTPLMRPAAEKLRQAARSFTFREPEMPLYLNLTAAAANRTTDWPDTLALHMCSPVRWTEEIRRMRHDGVQQFNELGPGQVLNGLIRRILPDVRRASFSSLADLDQAMPAD